MYTATRACCFSLLLEALTACDTHSETESKFRLFPLRTQGDAFSCNFHHTQWGLNKRHLSSSQAAGPEVGWLGGFIQRLSHVKVPLLREESLFPKPYEVILFWVDPCTDPRPRGMASPDSSLGLSLSVPIAACSLNQARGP